MRERVRPTPAPIRLPVGHAGSSDTYVNPEGRAMIEEIHQKVMEYSRLAQSALSNNNDGSSHKAEMYVRLAETHSRMFEGAIKGGLDSRS